MNAKITNEQEVSDLLLRWQSPRFTYLDQLDRFVDCTQYDGLRSWWDETVPLWERRPCIQYPIVAEAIASNIDLCLGEGRFPEFTSRPEEDDDDGEDSLGEESSKIVDAFLRKLVRRARLASVARQALRHAQSCGTSVTLVSVKNGELCFDHFAAKFCVPEFDHATGQVAKLTIEYPYTELVRRGDRWESVAKLFRRVVDWQRDVTFVPVLLKDALAGASMTEDPQRSVSHGLGFCPVVWWSFMRESSVEGRIDGAAIHAHCLDEIRAHDMTLSQRHRATLWCGDPQIVETGVSPDAVVAPKGRPPIRVPATLEGGQPGEGNPLRGSYVVPQPQQQRKKSPGVIWTYEAPDAKVYYLSVDPGALDTIDTHARDLRSKIAESLAVVFLEPESVKFAASMSGKAQEALRARQLSRCSLIREDMETGFFLPLLTMVARLVSRFRAGLQIDSSAKAAAVFAKIVVSDGSRVPVSLKWGSMTPPSIEDDEKVVNLTKIAKDAGLLTKRTAVERVAPIFGIEDVDAYLETLEEEAEEAKESMKEEAAEESFSEEQPDVATDR